MVSKKYLITQFLVEGTYGKSNSMRTYIYGYAIPEELREVGFSIEESIPLLEEEENGSKLLVKEKILSQKQFDEIEKQLDDEEYFQKVEGFKMDLQSFSVVKRPSVLQYDLNSSLERPGKKQPESIAPFLSKVKTFWTLEKKERLLRALNYHDGDDKRFNKALKCLLNALEDRTGLDFSNAYSERIGNFEIFDFPLGGCHFLPPVIVKMIKKINGRNTISSRSISIVRKDDLYKKKNFAHVVLINCGDVIFDGIKILGKNIKETDPIGGDEEISDYEVGIFTYPEGDLIFYECMSLIRKISMSMGIKGGARSIISNFSAKLSGETKKNFENATPFSTGFGGVHIGSYEFDPWSPSKSTVRTFVQNRVCEPRLSRWFPRGLAKQMETLEFIRGLIDNHNTNEVIIVDPFFGTAMFEKLLIRISHTTPIIKIYTCCLGKNPDTNTKEDNPRDIIKKACQDFKVLLPPRFKMVNVLRGKDQAFHDRYLVIKKKGGDEDIWMMSSSLNKAAGEYPFCMTKLETATAREVFYYISGFDENLDIAAPKAKTKFDVIWDTVSESEFNQKTNKKKQTQYNIPMFPLCLQAISLILSESVSAHLLESESLPKELKKLAEHNGLLHKDNDTYKWDFNSNKFVELFQKKIKALKELTPLDLITIGEVLARTNRDEEIITAISDALNRLKKVPSALKMLNDIEALYTGQLKEKFDIIISALTEEDLTIKAIYDVQDEISYDLYIQADSFLKYGFARHKGGLYGLYYSVKLFSKANPSAVVEWMSTLQHCKVRTIAIAYLVEFLTFHEIDNLIPSLLKSSMPFLRMMGATYINATSDRVNEIETNFEDVKKRLEVASFEVDDIVWILANRIQNARIKITRIRHRPENKDSREVESALNNLIETNIKKIAAIWPQCPLDDKKMYNFEAAISFNSRDRYEIAKKIEFKHPNAIYLLTHCIADVEKLMNFKNKNRSSRRDDFHFYGESDFPKLEYGAKAFVAIVAINKGEIANAFRNKYYPHLETLSGIVSAPFARKKNFKRWDNSVGHGLSCILFGFYILSEIINDSNAKNKDVFAIKLLEEAGNIIIGEQGAWHDMHGLVPSLSHLAGTIVSQLNQENIYKKVESLLANKFLTDIFKASLICIPEKIFLKHYEKGRDLLKSVCQKNESEYFLLLDFFIGNSFLTAKVDSKKILDEIDSELKKYPNIDKKWINFFKNILDALDGDQKKREAILCDPQTSGSYCGYILQKRKEAQ